MSFIGKNSENTSIYIKLTSIDAESCVDKNQSHICFQKSPEKSTFSGFFCSGATFAHRRLYLMRFLKSLFEETYISDIIGRNQIRNKAELEELRNILFSSVGSLTNPSKLTATFKSVKYTTISKTTIKRYINYFEETFLIDSAIRYDIKGRKYIGTPSKYYFTDLGLRNARLNFRQVEETHAMGNIIYNG